MSTCSGCATMTSASPSLSCRMPNPLLEKEFPVGGAISQVGNFQCKRGKRTRIQRKRRKKPFSRGLFLPFFCVWSKESFDAGRAPQLFLRQSHHLANPLECYGFSM